MAIHPFSDLSALEISAASGIVKKLHPSFQLVFKAISLKEPPKDVMIKYLLGEASGEKNMTGPPRLATCAYYLNGTVRSHFLWVSMIFDKH
jgi:primary-amine oxidase